eukprot:m.616805 g.616805  ORF g.616805 m.616805 type:complete len:447 (+) comp22514_c1_seq19:226-1566(+)
MASISCVVGLLASTLIVAAQSARLVAENGDLVANVECGNSLLVQTSCGGTANVSAMNEVILSLHQGVSRLESDVDAVRNEIIGNASAAQAHAVAEANRTASAELITANSKINRLNELLGDSLELLTNLSRCALQGLVAAPGGQCRYGRTPQCPPFNKTDPTRNYTESNGDTRVVGTQVMSTCNRAHFRTAGAEYTATCNINAAWNTEQFPSCTAKRTCSRGFYASDDGSSTHDRECSACPQGTYQAQEGSAEPECTPWSACGVGRYASVRTATANVTCTTCTAGTFQLNPMNNDNITSCRRPTYGRIIGRSCTASSRYNPDYDCRYALDNIFADGARRAWATRSQGAGSWFRMNFDSSYIGRIRFRQRGCSCEWYRRIQITFSPGNERRTINLAATRDQTISFPFVGPVVSAYLFFDQQYSRVNNGADEIQFQGFPTPRFPDAPGP